MARTVTEIQQEIISYKNELEELGDLNNTSKSSIWRLWTYITASAIWTHEKIVERNTLITRPHTLNWYREQALNFMYGYNLVWQKGFYQFDTGSLSQTEIAAKKIIKHCAVGEVDLESIFPGNEKPQTSAEIDKAVSQYFHNQVGIIFMKVAGENANGDIERVPNDKGELIAFKEYMRQIKDAGNQIQIISVDGDKLRLELDVYIDPLKIYINPLDIQFYVNPNLDLDHEFDTDNGVLIADSSIRPIDIAIRKFLKELKFNGGLVKTYLTDAIQKAEGVKIPIVRKMETAAASLELKEVANEVEYFIPQSGYFDISKLEVKYRYIPYTFYRDYI